MTEATRAAIYLRTAVQCVDAIQDQRQACAAYAAARGWTVVAEYSDDGASGVRGGHSGITALRNAVGAKSCDVVIVRDLARISRDHDQMSAFARDCAAAGVALVDLSAEGAR